MKFAPILRLLVLALALALPSLPAACTAAPGEFTAQAENTHIPLPTGTNTSMPCSVIFTPLGFLPDGNHLVGRQTVEGEGISRLQILDLRTLQVETIHEYSPSTMDQPVLSPDGKMAAVPQPDFSVQLVDLTHGSVQATLSGHSNSISAMVFSPAGDKLYTGSMDSFVRVWDISGPLLGSFQPDGADGLPSEITGLGISPDGGQLVTIPLEGWIKLWDARDFSRMGELEGPIFGSYNGSTALFSPNGRYLAVGVAAGPGAVSLWQVIDGTLLWRGGFFGFAFSPDGQIFARTQVGEGNELSEQVVLNAVDGRTPIRTLDETYRSIVDRMVFSSDGKKLAVSTGGRDTQVWNVADGEKLLAYRAACP